MADPLSLTRPLTAADAVLLAIDVQQDSRHAADGAEAVRAATERLIRAAVLLGVPVVAAELSSAAEGSADRSLERPLREAGARRFERTALGCLGDRPIKTALAETGRGQVIVVGVETHVAVQQTVLSLLRHGYRPAVCADAVASRRGLDHDVSLRRMRQAGAIVTTTESAIFELPGDAADERSGEVLALVR